MHISFVCLLILNRPEAALRNLSLLNSDVTRTILKMSYVSQKCGHIFHIRISYSVSDGIGDPAVPAGTIRETEVTP